MANLTKNRAALELAGGALKFVDPVAAATKIFNGAMVALDGSGNAIPAAPASVVMRGVAIDGGADNGDGAAGDTTVIVRRGVFLMNQTGLDRTDIGSDVFVSDDNTVAGTGTLVAGKLLDLTSEGAWVEFS